MISVKLVPAVEDEQKVNDQIELVQGYKYQGVIYENKEKAEEVRKIERLHGLCQGVKVHDILEALVTNKDLQEKVIDVIMGVEYDS